MTHLHFFTDEWKFTIESRVTKRNYPISKTKERKRKCLGESWNFLCLRDTLLVRQSLKIFSFNSEKISALKHKFEKA